MSINEDNLKKMQTYLSGGYGKASRGFTMAEERANREYRKGGRGKADAGFAMHRMQTLVENRLKNRFGKVIPQ